MTQLQNNDFLASISAADPSIEILGFALAGEGMARINVEVTHNMQSKKNPELVLAAIRNKLEGKMEAVAGTFKRLGAPGMYTDRLTGIVSTVRQTIPFQEGMTGFHAYASNMFIDDEKDIWQLRRTEAGDLLIKTSGIGDDLSVSGLLRSHSSGRPMPAGELAAFRAQCSELKNKITGGGDFVSYVNADNQIKHGFVLASISADANSAPHEVAVLPFENGGDSEVIKIDAVVDVHAGQFPEYEMTPQEKVEASMSLSRGNVSLEQIAAYYKKLYGAHNEFFQKLMANFKNHSYC